jgi:hypothetical protein
MVEVSGPIVLKGLAMDPLVDDHPFKSYSLSWRWKGDADWNTTGIRVPAGRGPTDQPWLSTQEQSAEGVLGFWDPPVGTGTIDLQVLVDDGTGLTLGRTSIQEVYRTSDQPANFKVVSSLPPQLASAVQTTVGMDIQSDEDQSVSYQAKVSMVDAQGKFLMGKDLIDLKASRFDGAPTVAAPGAFQLWRETGANTWHLKANGLCRSFTARILTSSATDLSLTCPTGWTCSQTPMTEISLPSVAGGISVNRTLELDVPASSSGEVVLALTSPGQLVLQGDAQASSCAVASGVCPSSLPSPPQGTQNWPIPQPGELVTGGRNLPWCDALGAIALDAGLDSWSDVWNGFRPDGTYPAPGTALMVANVWEKATGRLVSDTIKTTLIPGVAVIGAYSDGDLSLSATAPVVNQSANLHFTLQGRGANLSLQILKADGTVVRTLTGSGTWFEGRPVAQPYTVTWDGSTDVAGVLAAPGSYYFHVAEVGGTAASQIEVSVTSPWQLDPTIALSLPESVYDPGLGTFDLTPKPVLQLSATPSGQYSTGGSFTYAADFTGKQNILTFPSRRFSLMVNRHRNTVRFGILYHLNLKELHFGRGIDCGSNTFTRWIDRYVGVQIVETTKGQTVTIPVMAGVDPTTSRSINRFFGSGHTVEYQIVPLSTVADIQSYSSDPSKQWSYAQTKQYSLTTGSIKIDDYVLTPTFGQSDIQPVTSPDQWISPTSPVICDDQTMLVNGNGAQSLPHPCGFSSGQEFESHNPHRNLIAYQMHSGNPGSSDNSDPFSWGGVPSTCTGDADRNQFGFNMVIRVPDDYWNPSPGIDNLANKFLRFDSDNKFLFNGSAGYLMADGPDGNPTSDLSRQDGYLSPIDPPKVYHWQSRLSDVTTLNGTCPSLQTLYVQTTPLEILSSEPLPDAGSWTPISTGQCSFDANSQCTTYTQNTPDATWTPTAAAPCPEATDGSICQTFTKTIQVPCGTFTWHEEDGYSLAQRSEEEPLFFTEGDDNQSDETLTAWFMNGPDLSSAKWVATLKQGNQSLALNSQDNQGVSNPAVFTFQRGTGQNPSNWVATPVTISVNMQGSLSDYQTATGTTPVDWPLNPTSWANALSTYASAQQASGSHPSKIFLAASGVRFGLNDGLAPSDPASAYLSSAQQNFFTELAAGTLLDPNELGFGSIPTGIGRTTYSGVLSPNGTGAQTLVDQTNFQAPPANAGHLNPWNVVPTVLTPADGSISAALSSGPNGLNYATFTGPPPTSWSFVMDPRSGGASQISASEVWNSDLPIQAWPLEQLYTDATGGNAVPDQSLALFQNAGGVWSQNPSIPALSLPSLSLRWRTGASVNGAMTAQSLGGSAGSTWPTGVQVTRSSTAWGLPEYFPVLGSVPAGVSYELGWTSADGTGWNAPGGWILSTCQASDVAAHTCILGYLDAAQLPSSGQVGVVVQGAQGKSYQMVPVLDGTKVDPTVNTEVKSLWGDASVDFGPGYCPERPWHSKRSPSGHWIRRTPESPTRAISWSRVRSSRLSLPRRSPTIPPWSPG